MQRAWSAWTTDPDPESNIIRFRKLGRHGLPTHTLNRRLFDSESLTFFRATSNSWHNLKPCEIISKPLVIWDDLKTFEVLWTHSNIFESIWNHLKTFDAIRNHFKTGAIIWNHLNSFEMIWNILKTFEFIWSHASRINQLRQQIAITITLKL